MPLGYCTVRDIVTRFGKQEIVGLTIQESEEHDVNEVRLNDAIEGAEAEINYWLGVCYALPILIPVPIIVNEWAVLIARYKLYTQIRLSTGAGSTDHQSRRDYEDCVTQMKAVCKTVLTYPDGKLVTRIGAENIGPQFSVAGRTQYPCSGLHGCGCGNCRTQYADQPRAGGTDRYLPTH